jgi:Lamin Tail Domain
MKIALPVAFLLMGFLGKASGQLLVTEVMADPEQVTDANGEWIEVFNNSIFPLDLTGWTINIYDGGLSTNTISNFPAVTIPAQSYYVIGRSKDRNIDGNVPVDMVVTGTLISSTNFAIYLITPTLSASSLILRFRPLCTH